MNAALSNTDISKIVLGNNISGVVNTIKRSVEIDLAGKTIGNLVYDHENGGTSKITNSGSSVTIVQVDVDTKNANFELGARVTVTTKNLTNIKAGTYTNKGTINKLVIPQNAGRIDFENEGTAGEIEVKSEKPVNLSGTQSIEKVTVSKPRAQVNITEGSTVAEIQVEAAATGSKVTNNGTVTDLKNEAESTAVDGAGTIEKVTGDKAPEISEEVKVDKNESTATDIIVSNATQLQSALNNEKIKNIEFKNDIKATSQILVKQGDQSIDGKGFKLIAKSGMTYTEPNKSVLTVLAANGVSISNLTVDAAKINNEGWDGIYTVQVYNATGVKLNKVTLQNGDGGLLVNGSTITVESIKTSNNEFGGIEVSNGDGVKEQASTLTVTGESVHDEDVHIWTVGDKAGVVSEQYKSGNDIRDKKNGYINFILKTENRAVPYTEEEITEAKKGLNTAITATLAKSNSNLDELVTVDFNTETNVADITINKADQSIRSISGTGLIAAFFNIDHGIEKMQMGEGQVYDISGISDTDLKQLIGFTMINEIQPSGENWETLGNLQGNSLNFTITAKTISSLEYNVTYEFNFLDVDAD